MNNKIIEYTPEIVEYFSTQKERAYQKIDEALKEFKDTTGCDLIIGKREINTSRHYSLLILHKIDHQG